MNPNRKLYRGIFIVIFSLAIIIVVIVLQPKNVSESKMCRIYDEIKTPYKYGPVLVPFDNDRKMDSPNVFRVDGRWYMVYVVYDKNGYETWLAQSDNLIQWATIGMALWSTKDTWDANQKAGYIALVDNTWGGSYELKKFEEKYWMSYLGGATQGSKAGKLGVGIAFSDSLIPSSGWSRIDHPVLLPDDKNARVFEKESILKSTVIFDNNKTLGYPFVMFYNARGTDTEKQTVENEKITLAVSNNMIDWKRYGEKPILDHHLGITGDAFITRINDVWLMIYFGAYWKPGTFTGFACSYDLIHWTDWKGEDLIKPSEPFDRKFIHNSCIIKHKGVVYHFYSAVNENGQRGIVLATSADLGTSSLMFPSR